MNLLFHDQLVLHIHRDLNVMANTDPTGGGVSSGVEPSRRIVDEAVIAFVNRLSLRADFDVGDINRFKPEQIETVKDLIDRAIPQE